MSDSGIGMLLSYLSTNLLWLWFIRAFLPDAVWSRSVRPGIP